MQSAALATSKAEGQSESDSEKAQQLKQSFQKWALLGLGLANVAKRSLFQKEIWEGGGQDWSFQESIRVPTPHAKGNFPFWDPPF